MSSPPLVLVGWMVAAMVVVGGGLIRGWSLWSVGLLGIGLMSAAYVISRRVWNQTRKNEEKIRASLVELKQVTDSPEGRSSLPSAHESLGSELQKTVNQIKKRVVSLEEERKKISAIVENLAHDFLP